MRLLTGIACLLLLISCRGVPQRADAEGVWLKERQQYFIEHPEWQAAGRMAIQDGKRGLSVNFDWTTYSDEDYQLILRTTGGRWSLRVQPGFAVLEGTRIGRLDGPKPEPLVEQALGWPLPVALMQDWFRSLPGDQAAQLRFASDGSLLTIRHAEWAIDYTRYELVTTDAVNENTVLMPNRIGAVREPYEVRVLVSDWQL